MKKKLIVIFIFAWVLLTFSGAVFSGSPSYKKVLKKWTQTDTVYRAENFYAEILWSGTWLNDDMLAAQADKYAEVYEVSKSEEEAFLNELNAKRAGSVLFFVSFYNYNRHFDDLTNPRAKWDIRLHAGGVEFKPLRIEKLNRPGPLDMLFYPYLNAWSRGYYIWFSAEASDALAPYKLSVHGPFASSELLFK